MIILLKSSRRNLTTKKLMDLSSGCVARREYTIDGTVCLAEFFFGLSPWLPNAILLGTDN